MPNLLHIIFQFFSISLYCYIVPIVTCEIYEEIETKDNFIDRAQIADIKFVTRGTESNKNIFELDVYFGNGLSDTDRIRCLNIKLFLYKVYNENVYIFLL